MRSGRADTLRQRIRHRAVNKGPDQGPPPVHLQVTRGPDNRRTHIGQEHRVIRRQLVDRLRHVLGVQGLVARTRRGQIIQLGAGLAIVRQGVFQMPTVFLALQQGQQFPH